jgi:hypothetical protein
MVHCLIVPWTDAHGTFHDIDPSQVTPEAWMICHYPVYSVTVNASKSMHKWIYRPKRVSISSHITTIPATLPTFQQSYPRQRKKIRKTHRCMRLHAIFHSITRKLISPFVAPLPPHVKGSTSCEFHTNFSSATNRPPWFHIPTSESLEQPFCTFIAPRVHITS